MGKGGISRRGLAGTGHKLRPSADNVYKMGARDMRKNQLPLWLDVGLQVKFCHGFVKLYFQF